MDIPHYSNPEKIESAIFRMKRGYQNTVTRLEKENERLRSMLRKEDICPQCGENEASRFCKCNTEVSGGRSTSAELAGSKGDK